MNEEGVLNGTVSSRMALVLAAAAILAACAGAPARVEPPRGGKAATSEEKVYEGAGRDESMLRAMNLAKMDAVRKAVVDLIGARAEEANRDRLEQVLYGTANPNAYVDNETFQTTRKDKIGAEYLIEARVAVKLGAVQSTLRANGIAAGEAAGASAGEAAPTSGATAAEASSSPEVSPAEQRVIDRYVNTMTYMVYFQESSAEDPFYMKAAVGIANEYLASGAMEAVDLQQVESLKRDQQMVYEEETGRSVSIVQWIAQKLNADVYIEIDARTSGESSNGKYYGQASVTVKAFESSTGRLLGSQPWNSPRTFSTSSEEAARINALSTSVYKAMPIVVQQAKAYMAKALRSGIKYELVVQNTPDPRVMNDFRRRVRREVKDIATVSQTAEETRYNVYLIGSIEDLVDIVYDAADRIDALAGMVQVLLRGKSVTFDSGM